MKIYISGQISNLDYAQAQANFEHAKYVVGLKGHEPVSPMDFEETPDKTWAEYMAKDIILLDACDGIYMQANWRNSRGARIEHAIAEICGKHIFYEETGL